MNSLFQQTLKQLSFKTCYHNQTGTFGYDDLFASQRVIVFSLTNYRTLCSIKHLCGYTDNLTQFKDRGITNMYIVDSTDWLIGPFIDKFSTGRAVDVKGLPDRDMAFVKALADNYEYPKKTFDLARFWQYVVIINNGEPEKIWSNPFDVSAPLHALKDQSYRYRKLSADAILKYLIDNQPGTHV